MILRPTLQSSQLSLISIWCRCYSTSSFYSSFCASSNGLSSKTTSLLLESAPEGSPTVNQMDLILLYLDRFEAQFDVIDHTLVKFLQQLPNISLHLIRIQDCIDEDYTTKNVDGVD
ncbi:hypothetical protein U1Q18_036292, partial [Sarracenia purpurea var. burkii]